MAINPSFLRARFLPSFLPFLTSVFLSSVASSALADMRIDRAIVYFNPEAPPRQDVEVSNMGNENLYLKVEVLEVTNAGTENERRELVSDLDSIGFIASPATSVIPPHGKRRVRLLNLREASDKERIYRVTFKPILPELEAQSNAIKLLVAYQSLVIIRPKQVDIDVDAHTTDNGLLLSNTGNANVFLQDGRACHQASDECFDLPSKRLYAGNSWAIPSPSSSVLNSQDYNVSYVLNYGTKQVTKRF